MINVTKIIASDIELNGPMPLKKFMELALANKNYGYYTNVKNIGKNGDFITSPEISQLFGEILAIWCVNLWQILGSPKDIMIVELGPGNGTLACDIIRATKNIPGFHQAISLYFIELGNDLRNKQKSALDEITHIQKHWHENVSELPKKPAIFIANEFFDALPITQYIKRKNQWYSIGVDIEFKSKELCFTEIPVDEKTQHILSQEYSHVPQDGIIEIGEDGEQIIKQISNHIIKFNGGGLFIDYGYSESKDRLFISSLQAVKNHKYCPILDNIGNADISTHVNFTALKKAAELHGTTVHGPITQAEFLLNMQITNRKDRLIRNATSEEKEMILSGYNRLINSKQMGSLFKAIALTKPEINQFIGF
jgi:SAM-dependent MidA family methyltransferase